MTTPLASYGSWADVHWRGETSREAVADVTCPRCRGRAVRQPPVAVTYADGTVVERVVVECVATQCKAPWRPAGAPPVASRKPGRVRIIAECPVEIPETHIPKSKEEEQPTMARGIPTSQETKDELFRRVREGEHPADVGRNLGIKESTAVELVRNAGLSYTHKDPVAAMREANANRASQPLTPDDKKPRAFLDADSVTEGIRLCLDEGKSVMEASSRLGINYHSLKNHVTKARRARDLQEPPGPKPMSGVRMADIAPEQPPLAVRLLMSSDVREFLAQPPAVREAIVLLLGTQKA